MGVGTFGKVQRVLQEELWLWSILGRKKHDDIRYCRRDTHCGIEKGAEVGVKLPWWRGWGYGTEHGTRVGVA